MGRFHPLIPTHSTHSSHSTFNGSNKFFSLALRCPLPPQHNLATITNPLPLPTFSPIPFSSPFSRQGDNKIWYINLSHLAPPFLFSSSRFGPFVTLASFFGRCNLFYFYLLSYHQTLGRCRCSFFLEGSSLSLLASFTSTDLLPPFHRPSVYPSIYIESLYHTLSHHNHGAFSLSFLRV